ncbi:hypothetical protein F7725_018083 [Dissostichus mawsoni]|uniref:Uncharacterized protein n=1 Tax=Dissostichus mawsoni TaxID=36200 RepID=A0A7J5XQG1_DISMA|nr:hypothetical protein F7725_018083 [Dissostichus mawsoni]
MAAKQSVAVQVVAEFLQEAEDVGDAADRWKGQGVLLLLKAGEDGALVVGRVHAGLNTLLEDRGGPARPKVIRELLDTPRVQMGARFAVLVKVCGCCVPVGACSAELGMVALSRGTVLVSGSGVLVVGDVGTGLGTTRVCVYLAARLGPSFLWDFDGFFGLSLGLLQSDPLGPVSRQAAPGSPGARHWPSWTGHGIFQPACSLRPAQLKSKRRDKESRGLEALRPQRRALLVPQRRHLGFPAAWLSSSLTWRPAHCGRGKLLAGVPARGLWRETRAPFNHVVPCEGAPAHGEDVPRVVAAVVIEGSAPTIEGDQHLHTTQRTSCRRADEVGIFAVNRLQLHAHLEGVLLRGGRLLLGNMKRTTGLPIGWISEESTRRQKSFLLSDPSRRSRSREPVRPTTVAMQVDVVFRGSWASSFIPALNSFSGGGNQSAAPVIFVARWPTLQAGGRHGRQTRGKFNKKTREYADNCYSSPDDFLFNGSAPFSSAKGGWRPNESGPVPACFRLGKVTGLALESSRHSPPVADPLSVYNSTPSLCHFSVIYTGRCCHL